MVALAGTVKGDSVILENDDIHNYDGRTFIITFLDQKENRKRKQIDWDSYGMETERGKHVEEYMEEIRGNDRI